MRVRWDASSLWWQRAESFKYSNTEFYYHRFAPSERLRVEAEWPGEAPADLEGAIRRFFLAHQFGLRKSKGFGQFEPEGARIPLAEARAAIERYASLTIGTVASSCRARLRREDRRQGHGSAPRRHRDIARRFSDDPYSARRFLRRQNREVSDAFPQAMAFLKVFKGDDSYQAGRKGEGVYSLLRLYLFTLHDDRYDDVKPLLAAAVESSVRYADTEQQVRVSGEAKGDAGDARLREKILPSSTCYYFRSALGLTDRFTYSLRMRDGTNFDRDHSGKLNLDLERAPVEQVPALLRIKYIYGRLFLYALDVPEVLGAIAGNVLSYRVNVAPDSPVAPDELDIQNPVVQVPTPPPELMVSPPAVLRWAATTREFANAISVAFEALPR